MKKFIGIASLAIMLGGAAAIYQTQRTAGEAEPTQQTAAIGAVTSESEPSAAPGMLVSTAAETATLKAKFVFDGEAPEREKIDGSRDPYCANVDILSENMLVGEDGGLRNLVMFMDPRDRGNRRNVPDDYPAPNKQPVVLDNKECAFIPRVFFAQAGQTIKVTNSDPVGHNAKFTFFNNPGRNPLIPANKSIEFTVDAGESVPMPVECNIHPWMKAYVIVQEHPYVGITNDKGELTIENLPATTIVFKVWHENTSGAISEIDMEGEKKSLGRGGTLEIELEPGENDLGVIKLSPDLFN